MKICKDGRIWGQNNKEADTHLGIKTGRQYKYISIGTAGLFGRPANSASFKPGHTINVGRQRPDFASRFGDKDGFEQKRRKALQTRPTKEEWVVTSIIQDYDLPFAYVGDGDVIIGGRNPDFININGQKQVIEIFGRYWHDRRVNPKVRPQTTEFATQYHYGQYGFQCLIIWDYELKRPPEVLKRIRDFLEYK